MVKLNVTVYKAPEIKVSTTSLTAFVAEEYPTVNAIYTSDDYCGDVT